MRAFVMVGKWSQVRDALKALAEVEREFPDLLGLCLDHWLDLR